MVLHLGFYNYLKNALLALYASKAAILKKLISDSKTYLIYQISNTLKAYWTDYIFN